MTQIDEPNLVEKENYPEDIVKRITKDTLSIDELDKLLEKHQLEAGELTFALKQDLLAFIATQIQEARINEMERFANAKINHQGEPALFNPDGLPISTPITEEMTRLVNQAAKDRIAQLRSTPNDPR